MKLNIQVGDRLYYKKTGITGIVSEVLPDDEAIFKNTFRMLVQHPTSHPLYNAFVLLVDNGNCKFLYPIDFQEKIDERLGV